MWECMILLGYECMILVPLMPLNCWIYVNCCHAKDVFMSKYEFYISGLMNARLSVHCSLKHAKRRNYRFCTLTSSLKRTDKWTARLSVQHLHNIFENTSYGPKCNPMLFFANFCNLTKPQCQETKAHYILEYYKWNAWVTLTFFNGEWHMRAR